MMVPFSFYAAVGHPFGGVPQKQVRVSRPVVILFSWRLLLRRQLKYYRKSLAAEDGKPVVIRFPLRSN
jgi:hypothetical protein